MSFKYETHSHTFPVSKCGKATVEQTLDYYKTAGYDGVFITNHFLDGNINVDRSLPYKEKLDFYFSDFKAAEIYGKTIGIKVFLGVEISHRGSDFLIYGLPCEWYYGHPEIMEMDKRSELALLAENGAYIVHAHPYREDSYIDHIRLYPRSVHAVEILNASRFALENNMAKAYAEAYGLRVTAGSDNHRAGHAKAFGGIITETPINSVEDYIRAVSTGELTIFYESNEENYVK